MIETPLSSQISLSALVPSSVRSKPPTLSDIKPLLTMYRSLLPEHSNTAVESELSLWADYWSRKSAEDIPSSAVASIEHADGLPIISVLLSVLAVVPVTSCEPERIFSKVGTVLTKIRSTMSESKLEDIILIQCNRGRLPSTSDILERFASRPGRRGHFY